MLEIRWRPGSAEAEVAVNRDFRFGDLNVMLLQVAFDVEGRTVSGVYETLAPARVAWGATAAAGRITARGRVRALGA